MDEVLRGNFTPKRKVAMQSDVEESLEASFEKEALKKLGGSIAFVSKRKVMWNKDEIN